MVSSYVGFISELSSEISCSDLAAVKESIKATLKSQWDELDARAREM
jgi:hypothetical protein